MTTDEDPRHPLRRGPAGARRRLVGQESLQQRFRVKPFLLGLSYGFALGFILEAILASHP